MDDSKARLWMICGLECRLPVWDKANGKAFLSTAGTCALDNGSTKSGPVKRPKLRQKCNACI